MKPSTHCPICGEKNNSIWVIVKIGGAMKKVCKPCTEKAANAPFDLTAVQRNKDRLEAERKTKNAQILRALKDGTLPNPPDTWRK